MLDLGTLAKKEWIETRENLLSQFAKIVMPSCGYCLDSKTTRMKKELELKHHWN